MSGDLSGNMRGDMRGDMRGNLGCDLRCDLGCRLFGNLFADLFGGLLVYRHGGTEKQYHPGWSKGPLVQRINAFLAVPFSAIDVSDHKFSRISFPFAVSLYRCLLLFGFSGIVISIKLF